MGLDIGHRSRSRLRSAVDASPIANLVGSRRNYRPIVVAAIVLAIAGCTSRPPRKITFIGQAEGVRQPVNVPVGLNPLASLDICLGSGEPVPPSNRVLVSPPEYFSPIATKMILSLRESLVAEEARRGLTVDMLLAERPLRRGADAVGEGRRCGAVIVLWEPVATGTLELTLPYPAQVPLRHMVHERLCEFGNHAEQLTILHLTIVGLAAMLENRYDEAVYFMEAADRIDAHCLQLPVPLATDADQ